MTSAEAVIGLLVLLFGQPVSRILQLRTTNVILDSQRTALRLADDELEVPEPAATLLRCYIADPRHRRNTAAHPNSPWLFPGAMPGRPLHVFHAANALRKLGISPRAAHTGTWLVLVREAPPSVLAETLGISPATAMRHAARADADTWLCTKLAQNPLYPENAPSRHRHDSTGTPGSSPRTGDRFPVMSIATIT